MLRTTATNRVTATRSRGRTAHTAAAPPRHRLLGGDLPRGGTPGSVGHAGRMCLGAELPPHMAPVRSAATAAVRALLVLLALCASLGLLAPPPVALAQEMHNLNSISPKHSMYALDAGGGHRLDFYESHAFVDERGVVYKCVDPFKLFSAGTFTEEDISSHYRAETINKCGLAQYWCEEHVDSYYSQPAAQVFVWKILTNEGYLPDAASKGIVNWCMTDFDTDAAFQQFEAWYAQSADSYTGHGSYWVNGTTQAVAYFWGEHNEVVPDEEGGIKIKKVSSQPSLTVGNHAYMLAGARFKIWRDAGCTQDAGADDLVTTSSGSSNTVSLEPGTYWVKESKAPVGYQRDGEAHKVTVRDGSVSTVRVTDVAKYDKPKLWIEKLDTETGAVAQGSATLKGAQYTVCYYDVPNLEGGISGSPARTWVLETDEDGRILISEDAKVDGDDLYYDASGEISMPRGIYTIQETKEPTGYWLEGKSNASPDAEVPIHQVAVDDQSSYAIPITKDNVRRAGVAIEKLDEETGPVPQGAASFEGITFEIVNRNKQGVKVDGVYYASGEVVKTLVTDARGRTSTAADCLPVGTYEVRESATNRSMLLTAKEQFITLRVEDTNKVMRMPSAYANAVVRGAIRVGKVSRETGLHLTQGEAVLEGAKFSITLLSENPVKVNGALHNKGEVVCTITTNAEGYARTNDRSLPYGKYLVREVEPPEGFLLNEEWSQEVFVEEEGKTYDYSDEYESVDDQVKRGGFHFNKVDEDTMDRMAYTPFRITSTATGESHVIVADENGLFNSDRVPHSTNTNANDAAVGSDGVVDEAALDPEAGVWFEGSNDLEVPVPPNDELGAFPYDTYLIQELPVSGNEEKKLVSFVVRIRRHDDFFDMGTVDNKNLPQASMGTTLTYNGTVHVAPAMEQCELVDEVAYDGLEPGQEYVLTGTLMDKATGEPLVGEDGEPVTATKTFTPVVTTGTESLSFVVDTTGLEGRELVAFEHLYIGQVEYLKHDDIEDEAQTVRIPRVGTTLADVDGNKVVCAGEHVVLVDHVHYEGVEPKRSYEIAGTLMDKATGEPLVGEDGNEVKAIAAFVANKSEGTAEVRFSFEGGVAVDKTIVAFEQLKRDEVVYARHEDLKDADQTVVFPGLKTELHDGSGSHELVYAETIELVDTVDYHGLVAGETYEIQGTLMDKATGEPVTDGRGNELRSSTTFEAKESDGTETVTFQVTGSLLAGKTVVAFETLRHDGRDLAIHADINDEAQTVNVPRIATMATDADDGDKNLATTGTVRIRDVVSYEGLVPGETYLMRGALHHKNSGEPVMSDQGAAVTAEATFVPEQASGSMEVIFELDASWPKEDLLVVFESCLHADREVATHADLNDASQTIARGTRVEVPQEKAGDAAKQQAEAQSGTSSASKSSDGGKASSSKQSTPSTGDGLPQLSGALGCSLFLLAGGWFTRRLR